MYSVRDDQAKDFAKTVRELRDIGFSGVELAGFGNLKSAAEVKKACDDAGLLVTGMHVPLDRIQSQIQQVAEEAILFGKALVILPWLPEEKRKTADDWKKVGSALNTAGQSLAKHGLEIAYHNHSFEFQKFDGQTGLDLLFAATDPALVKAELDVYWVQHGGYDPVQFIQKYSTRLPAVHLKDMAPGADKKFAPAGTGILDFSKILAACDKANVRWGVIEQDLCYDTPPMQAMKIAFDAIQKIAARAR
jgi:sugar phosphate isomerase/epimerase